MSNTEAKNFRDQGMAFFEVRDYGPALQKMETALSLVEPWDTQFREDLRHRIEVIRECAKAKEEADYHDSQAAYYNKLVKEAQEGMF